MVRCLFPDRLKPNHNIYPTCSMESRILRLYYSLYLIPSHAITKPPADLSSEPQLDTSVRHLGKCHHSFSLCNKIVVHPLKYCLVYSQILMLMSRHLVVSSLNLENAAFVSQNCSSGKCVLPVFLLTPEPRQFLDLAQQTPTEALPHRQHLLESSRCFHRQLPFVFDNPDPRRCRFCSLYLVNPFQSCHNVQLLHRLPHQSKKDNDNLHLPKNTYHSTESLNQ